MAGSIVDQQFKPLAPFISFTHFSSPNQLEDQQERKTKKIKKFIRWCGSITALLLICIVILIVLVFTVYNVKEPEVRMNSVTVINGNFANNRTSSNVTLLADVSVKNPNHFTFRYGNTTTIVYYDGIQVGEGTTPPGKAKARRTMRFNVTMEIMATRLLNNQKWIQDIRDLSLDINSFTRMDGRVKIFNLFKRKVVVELNCTSTYNITTALITHPHDHCIAYVDV